MLRDITQKEVSGPVMTVGTGTAATSSLTISGAQPYLTDAELILDMRSTNPLVQVTLESPSGKVITILSRRGGNGSFRGTRFFDRAGRPITDTNLPDGVLQTELSPQEAFGALIGDNPNGTWKLKVSNETGDPVNVDKWSVRVTGTSGCTVEAPTISRTNPPSPSSISNPAVFVDPIDADLLELFTNDTCTGSPAASNTDPAFWPVFGLKVTVPLNARTRISARITRNGVASRCSSSLTYVNDTIGPVTTITSGPAGPTGVLRPTWTFAVDEPSVKYECLITRGQPTTGAWPECTGPGLTHSPVFASTLPYWLYIRATDLAGNVGPIASVNFYYDDTAPETRILTGPGYTREARPTFTFTGDPAGDTARAECSVDQGTPAWVPCSGGTQSHRPAAALTDGTYTFRVRAIDAIGNVDPSPATRSFTVDRTAPDTMFFPRPPYETGTDASFTFFTTLAGDLVTYECAIDDASAWQPCSAGYSTVPVTYNARVAPGDHVFFVRAIDAAGNIDDTPEEHPFTAYDLPDTQLLGGPSGATSDRTPKFLFLAEPLGPSDTYECSFDQGTPDFAPCGQLEWFGTWAAFTQQPAAPLAEGRWTFRVRATNVAGTDPTPATQDFTVDATAPDTVITAAPDGPTNDATPEFGFAADPSQDVDGFDCAIDDEALAPCSGPGATHTPSAPLSDGEHRFRVQARDTAGNVDPTPAERTFTVDTTPPDTAIDDGPTGTIGTARPKFAFSSPDADLKRFECQLEVAGDPAGPWFTCPADYRPEEPLIDGDWTLRVRALDTAGNVDPSPAERQFTVDNTPPDTVISDGPTGSTPEQQPRFAFAGDPAADTASFECSIDQGTPDFQPCSGTGDTHAPSEPLVDGPYTFRVRAIDAVGNKDRTPATREFAVDAGTGILRPGKPIALSDRPSQVVTDDFNGDGKVDVATASGETGRITASLGKGDGTFQAPVEVKPGVAGTNQAIGLAVGDFDGDEYPDLTTGSEVFIGQADGTFDAGVATGLSGEDVAVGDLDADGNDDLVVSRIADDAALVARGNGDGTFQAPASIATVKQPGSPIVSDIDRDGDLDVVVGGRAPDDVAISVLRNDGTGTLTAERYDTPAQPFAIAITDVNGDLRPDLSFGHSFLPGRADGSLGSAEFGPVSSDDLAVADFDGDGFDDQVVAGKDSPEIFVTRGLGDGTFDPSTQTTDVGTTGGDFLADLASADLNRDGRPDILAAKGGQQVDILLNREGAVEPGAGRAVLSEVRFSGPQGARDAYVQIANTSRTRPLRLDGWILWISTDTRVIFPPSTIVQPGGTLLVNGPANAANGWSLGSAARSAFTLPRRPLGISLHDATGTRVDAVGLGAAGSTFREGTPLPPFDPAGQGAYVRRMEAGKLVDTGDNAADFQLLDPQAPADISGGTVLGAPRPDGAFAPTNRNDILQSSLLDPTKPVSAAPNRQVGGGFLTVRRTLTNCSGGLTSGVCVNADPSAPAVVVKKLRFRITDLSTYGNSDAAQLLAVPGAEAAGLPLDAPTPESGGGLNTTLTATQLLPSDGLAPGESITVAFRFRIARGGAFRFGYSTEDDLVPVKRADVPPPSKVDVPEALPAPETTTGSVPLAAASAPTPTAAAPTTAAPGAAESTSKASPTKKKRCVSRAKYRKLRGKARQRAKVCAPARRPAAQRTENQN